MDFPATGDHAAVADELPTAVATYGQPFIDRWADWSTFSSDIADSGLLLDKQRHFILPAVAALNGDRELADRLIRQELDRTAGSDDVYATAYRDSATQFHTVGP